MEGKAIARNVRISPEKVKLVVDQIKNKKPADAVKMLEFVNKRSAPAIRKVIMSAIANAKNNHNRDEEAWVFKQMFANRGLVYKRHRLVSRGRFHPILKRTSLITVVLEGEKKKEVSKVPEVSKGSKGQKE